MHIVELVGTILLLDGIVDSSALVLLFNLGEAVVIVCVVLGKPDAVNFPLRLDHIRLALL